MNLNSEFDRQVKNLINKNYPALAGMTEENFIHLIDTLRTQITNLPVPSGNSECLPFVIVIKSGLVPTEKAMEQIVYKNQQGHVNMIPTQPAEFKTIESVTIPDSSAYLIANIDTGKETLNVTPYDALIQFNKTNKSPLTIDEGVAILTQYPDILRTHNCFSLLASRQPGQKVPALWISYKRPRLGWCWDNNPHTWLGSASCASRIG